MIREDIVKSVQDAVAGLLLADLKTRVDTLNAVRREIAKLSAFKDPVDCVEWISASKIHGNDYNPNKVAPPEMRLLEVSIKEDGYTQPIVAFKNADGDTYTVVDGFHRLRVGKESKIIQERVHGYLPLVIIDKPEAERMASTIRHNRARGKHGVAPMSEIVAGLSQGGWEDERIARALGMDADEILRLKQRTGIADLFGDREFSAAWEEVFGNEKEV